MVRFRAGYLLDGEGEAVKRDVVLEAENGMITAVRRAEPGEIAVDYSRHTILPGLIDSHLHLFMSGTTDFRQREKQLRAGFDQAKSTMEKNLYECFKHGVVAVRDGGDSGGFALRYKKECFGSTAIPLILKVAGKAWIKPERYGKLIGRPPKEGQSLAEAIEEKRVGIDHVKIVNSGLNSLTSYGKQTPPQFELGELRQAVETAGSLGHSVMVHANGEKPVEIALEAGCRSIEHGYFMGKKNLEKMAEKGVFWIPTASPMKAYADHLGDTDPDKKKVAEKTLVHQLEQMQLARSLGVRIALGTDAGGLGVFHGAAMAMEMELFLRAGFSVPETIRLATANGADLLGINRLGRLVPGKEATFVVVKGGAKESIPDLKDIEAIYIKGRSRRISG